MTHPTRPDELDSHDLGAHSQHAFRLFGGEEMWVDDIRGKGGAPDPDITVRFKNVALSGHLSTIAAFGELLAALATEVVVRRDEIERYDTYPTERRFAINGPRVRLPRPKE